MGFTLVVPGVTENIRRLSVDFIEALFNAAGKVAVHYFLALPDPRIQHAQRAAIAISYPCQLFLMEIPSFAFTGSSTCDNRIKPASTAVNRGKTQLTEAFSIK